MENTGYNEELPRMGVEKYSPDNPHWNMQVAFGYWILSLGAIFAAQAGATMIYAAQTGKSVAAAVTDPTGLLIAIIAVLPAHAITLAVGWMIATRIGTYSFSEMLGMKWGGFRWWHVVLILSGMIAAFAAFLQIFGEQENEFDRLLKSSRAAVYAVAFMATISAPIVEEVLYRGVLYSAVKKSLNTVLAVIIVTFVFAGVHFLQYWGDLATIFSLLTLSLVLTLVRTFTGNILPCIALHFVFNGIQSFILIIEPWLKLAK